MVSESLPSPQARGPRAFHSTDYIRLQQELIAVRTSFDRQIAQLTRLNRISNTLLSLQQGGHGLQVFAETIPDVLDMAIGVVWELSGRQVVDHSACGLDLEGKDWRHLSLELLDRLLAHETHETIRADAAEIPLLAQSDLCDVLICRCINGENQCIGVVMAANTVTLSGMFDPISNETLAVLTQVAERFAAHLEIRRFHDLLDLRLQELKDSEERLLRVLQGTNDGWWDWDLSSNLCLVSSRWIAMLGGESREPQLREGFWLECIQPSDRDRFERNLRQALEGQGADTLEQEMELCRKDGRALPVLVRGTVSHDDQGQAVRFSGTILDLTERKRHEAHVHRLAFYDDLTELPNRRGLMDQLPGAIASFQTTGQRMALVMIDLDGFKTLNDTYGHAAGDQMLRIVGQRLRQRLRNNDLVARLGGDEFMVVLHALGQDLQTAQARARGVAEEILDQLSQPYQLDVGISHHSASIGVAVIDHRSATASDLMQHADVALYESKGAGRATVRVFNTHMQEQVTRRVRLEQELRTSIEQQELALHLQGIVNGAGILSGAEALLRWPRSGGPVVKPDDFIAIAEDSGLIHTIGEWSLMRVGAVLRQWSAELPADFRISVNLSPNQFLHPQFVERTLQQLQDAGIESLRLKLEITEATIMDDLDKVTERMNHLRDHGVEFSLDDFGTGYSSISYLRQLPFKEVKIDKSYVQRFLSNPNDDAVIRSVVSLCQSLGMDVVAEGIETEEQWHRLRDYGCDRFQGYLFSLPREPGPTGPGSLLHPRWQQTSQD
ncbi:EAL domain-containing protein [Vulcanococcus limneticus Candia 3F8]|uniref:putative bifunctional diguanylate cyclase/phosphodiesterase n=1 Tax=Vulcanococcus limneticus TaxID=2170428 RepID=UPI000B98A9A3|nr:EAL domain-containing protein [Vulcanococcus limneticus]MCP9791275.1 EAL domain-containing protein [Vulcanococcus limneticus MW73D5]MCP9893305.1 EAL domain-containing protein [Vulcanococcus limneticus Candia 3F8]MCP9896678.1 EAL domain-containing protein [Vulcanococcus limneticus Candia 3B3]